MAEKKRKVDPTTESVAKMADALQVPFRLWEQQRMSRDVALRILSFLDVRDVARTSVEMGKSLFRAAGSKKEGQLITLRELRQTHVVIPSDAYEAHWLTSNLPTTVTYWHNAVQYVTITGFSRKVTWQAVLNTSELLDRSGPYFPSLLSLTVHNRADMTPQVWLRLLDNCPKLHSLYLSNVQGHVRTEQRMLDWPHKRRAWQVFHIEGMFVSASLAAYIAIANPSLRELVIESSYSGKYYGIKWTLAKLRELVDKWEGQGTIVRNLCLGPFDTPDDPDAMVRLMMESFPSLASRRPWSDSPSMPLKLETLYEAYRKWPCFSSLPPPPDVELKETDFPVLQETHGQMLRIEANGRLPFWRAWALADVERLIQTSKTWQQIMVEDFKGDFSTQTLDWLADHATALEWLEIKQNVHPSVATLKKLSSQVHVLEVGNENNPALACQHDIKDVQASDVIEILDQFASSSWVRGREYRIQLLYGVLSSWTANDLMAVFSHWQKTKRDVSLAFLVPKALANELPDYSYMVEKSNVDCDRAISHIVFDRRY